MSCHFLNRSRRIAYYVQPAHCILRVFSVPAHPPAPPTVRPPSARPSVRRPAHQPSRPSVRQPAFFPLFARPSTQPILVKPLARPNAQLTADEEKVREASDTDCQRTDWKAYRLGRRMGGRASGPQAGRAAGPAGRWRGGPPGRKGEQARVLYFAIGWGERRENRPARQIH